MAKLEFKPGAIEALLKDPASIAAATEATAAACNAQSSWGGYDFSVTVGSRARGIVWSYARQDGTGSTERANRMIANLGG